MSRPVSSRTAPRSTSRSQSRRAARSGKGRAPGATARVSGTCRRRTPAPFARSFGATVWMRRPPREVCGETHGLAGDEMTLDDRPGESRHPPCAGLYVSNPRPAAARHDPNTSAWARGRPRGQRRDFGTGDRFSTASSTIAARLTSAPCPASSHVAIWQHLEGR